MMNWLKIIQTVFNINSVSTRAQSVIIISVLKFS